MPIDPAPKRCKHPAEQREDVCTEDAFYVLCKLCGRAKYNRETPWRKPKAVKPVVAPGCEHRAQRQVEEYDPGTKVYRTRITKTKGGGPRVRRTAKDLELWRKLWCPSCDTFGYHIRGEQTIRWQEPIT